MIADVVLYSMLICCAAFLAGPGGTPASWPARLALALAFTVLIRLAWQFYLFLQTDIYYVFATALGWADLHEATRTLIRNRVWRILRRDNAIVDDSEWTDRDRQVARWYAPFYVIGVLVMLGFGVLALVPIAVGLAVRMARGLASSGLGLHFWDSAVALTFTSSQFVIVAVLIIRERRRAGRSHTVIEEDGS